MRTFISLIFLMLYAASAGAQKLVEVLVTDAETGENIPMALLEVHETGALYEADVEGYLQLRLGTGRYHLHLSAAGYEASEMDLSVTADTLLRIQLVPTFVELKEVLVEDNFSRISGRKLSQDIQRINLSENQKALESSLAELLSKSPGIEAFNTGVGIAKPVIRGFTATRVAVFDQGIKQEGQQWGMDHGLEIDPFNAGRVEIIKGAGALQYGSDAVSGVVKLLPDPLPEEGFSGVYTGLYKSNNNSLGNSLKVSFRKNQHFVSGRVSYQQYEDYRIPAEEFIYNSFVLPVVDNRLKNTAGKLLSGRVTYGFQGKNYNLRLMGSHYRQKVGLYPGATGVPRAYDVGRIGDVSDIELPNQEVTHSKIYGKLNLKLGKNWLTTDVGFQHNQRKENSNPHTHGLLRIDESNTLALGLRLRTFSLNSNYSWTAGKLSFALGTNQQFQSNQKSGWEYLLPDFEAYNGGVFGLVKGEWNARWSWNTGLRLDYGNLHSEEHFQPWYNDPDSLVLRSPAVDRNFFNYAAAAGLAYFPSDQWNFKLNLAKSFRIPVPAELVSNGVHHGTFRHEVGNPELDPEEALQLDIAATYQQKSFYLKLTPFVNYFFNFLYLRPAGRFSTLPDAGQLYRYSQAEAVHTGAEFFAEYHPWQQLHLSTALEYVHNLNLETGLPLPFTPPLSNLISAEYEIISKQKYEWTIGAEYRLTAAQERTDRNERATPGYQLFNLKTSVELPLGNTHLSLAASVLNLGNTAYLRHLSRYRILNLPEQGRNIVVSAALKF